MQTQKQFLGKQHLLMSVGAAMECRIRKDRQCYFNVARGLANAQFVLADEELICRLWQDVAGRKMDLSRILHLLYGGWDLGDEEEMLEADQQFQSLKIL